MLPMGELTNPGQMRLALVQVVNWGTFHGAHTMHVDRNGTLLTGNSGVGKSTLFDAMLRVFDARPRSNEAAAQRAGGAVEDKRTTFTYMRGKVGDKAVGEGSASAFQRPGATWSAVALTFDNAAGTTVTVSALFDLPKNGTESSVGRYYLIDNRPLDLAAVEGIAGKRFTKSALDAIFPDAQIFDVHKAFAERFRRLLGISSDQALPLLRVIQAGKGLGGSVNTFFRDQVLDAPATLTAADDVVEEFSNLMSIRQRLEDVRQQRDQLAPVPGLNKEYAQSLLDANRLRDLAGEEFEAYRQQLAVTVHEQTLERYRGLAQAKAKELGAERSVRDGLAKELRQLEAEYNNQGGNAISAIEQSLENARVGLRLRQQVEESARKALSDAGLELQWSASGWEQAHTHAAARSAELKDDSEALKELRFEAFDGHATRKRELAAAQQELVSLKTRKSLLPPSSIENRASIAAATGVPEEQMPFGGELIDLAEGQEQWRPAAERALRSLATTLLVPGKHFAAVTGYLNDHSVRGALRAVDVSKPLSGGALAVQDVADGDLLTKLGFLTDVAPHSAALAEASTWIRERIALDFAYPCVDDPDELAGLDKGLSLGGVVKRNRHTVEKDDRFTSRQDYVLGFDNASKLELVAAQVEDLQQELAKAAELAQSREESHQGMTRQLDALRRVADDHRPWEQVSAAVAADELAMIEQRLKAALAAQADLDPLRASIEAARHKHQSSTEAAAVLQSEYKALDSQMTAADSLLEAARKRLEQSPPPDATVSALEPYFTGFGDVREMHELDNLANHVRTRLLAELHAAESRGQATSERLTRIFEGFVREWGTAISADHGTSVGAAGEFEARYHGIVSDGLPAQEAEFRQFFNQRTHESFSTLLHLLDEERRSITSRILPLNGILSEVNFHEGSFLELDIKQTLPATAKQFKDAVQNALKVRHARPGKAAAAGASGTAADDDAELTNRYKSLETLVKRLGSQTPEDRRWRAEVLDVRGHLFIQCKEHREVQGRTAGKNAGKAGRKKTEVFMHADTGSMSGGERQRFTAFIMAAALSYQLGIAEQGFTTYGTVMMDEAFVLASEEFAGAGIKALHEFGFQLLLAAPENVIDLSRHLGSVTEILRDKRTNRSGVLTAPVITPKPGSEGEWRSEANPVDIVLR
jgi:uncharacterized protein YPO0396